MKTFLLLCLLLTGCGAEKEFEVDPAFKPMLSYYLSIAPNEGHLQRLASVQFSTDIPAGDRGITEEEKLISYRGKTYSSVFHVKIRYGLTENVQNAAVLHELGHALHGLHHVQDGSAIMAKAQIDDETFWQANLEIKAHEMFEGQ